MRKSQTQTVIDRNSLPMNEDIIERRFANDLKHVMTEKEYARAR